MDDGSMSFHRADGDPRSRVICFLPWCMPYRLASAIGLVPKSYHACYEMPPGIVSSEPRHCLKALLTVASDAEALVKRSGHKPHEMIVIGLSIGNAAATYVANLMGAKLISIASADRGDLTLWESPASRHIKARAVEKGYSLKDFSDVLEGFHAVENLSNLAPGSVFHFGSRDELIPEARRLGLAKAVREVRSDDASIIHRDACHIGTMVEALRESLAGNESPRARDA